MKSEDIEIPGDAAVDAKTRAIELLQEHEGYREKPYLCSAKKLTIGYGRNLEDRGIDRQEATYLLANDIDEAMSDLATFPWWFGLNAARQSVLIDLRVNLGYTRFRGFKNMIGALDIGDFDEAAAQIIDSKAYRTNEGLKRRYGKLATIMKNGF